MTLNLIVEKLARINKKFITSKEIKDDCRKLSLNYLTTIKYLIRHRYLARIFKGIFYNYSIEERKLGKEDMNFYEILKEALHLKHIEDWYFGLETGLKFNNLTHEYFTIYYVITDSLFRAKPITIMGKKVKFFKISKKMFSFGIIIKDFPYSNPEKTLLDLYYLKHYTKEEFREIAETLSKSKLTKYAKNYDTRTKKAVQELS